MLRVACGVHALSVHLIDLHTSYVRVFPSTVVLHIAWL